MIFIVFECVISRCAKQLIEDTIRRNASPIPLEEGMLPIGESASSIASSASDDMQKPMAIAGNGDIFNTGKSVLPGNYFMPNSTNHAGNYFNGRPYFNHDNARSTNTINITLPFPIMI